MITEIHYSNGFYAIEIDGQIVDHASTQHEADVIVQGLQESEASWQMGGMPDGIYCPHCNGEGCKICDWRPRHVSSEELDMALKQINAVHVQLERERRPLLVQCAEVIRACLGNPMATSGIVDELRRVERALSEQGW